MTWKIVFALLACSVLAGAVTAQPADLAGPPLVNWTAPPYWTPPATSPQESGPDRSVDGQALGIQVAAMSLPSAPVPFVAIPPCRIVDTRVSNPDGFHSPSFSDNETRTYTFPSSTGCPGLPSTSVAYSINVQFRTISQPAFITLYPTGTSRPLVSTTVGNPASFVTDAAIVPAGTGGAIDVYCQFAGRVVIDINGYYETENIVNTLNTVTGDVTLSAGSNVTITPSGNTLTIAATGGPGGVLPTGTLGQTLYNSGSLWTASSALTDDGTNVGVAGILNLPNTTSSTGHIDFGGTPFLHNYGPASAGNTFVGQFAGNFTMGGTDPAGRYNTAIGYASMFSNTTGHENTASGYYSLASNTTGAYNTASGYLSLSSNTTGQQNTASGYQSLSLNTTGSNNAASGFAAGQTNATGSGDTFLGVYSDAAADNLIDAAAIGYNTKVDASHHVRIGDTLVTEIGGQVAWSNLSDARHKVNIRDLDLGLDFVLALRPVAFTLESGDGRTNLGFLAQDVEALLGDGYSVLGIGGDADRTLSLRYTDLIAPLVKAIQEQQALIDQLTKRIASLEEALAASGPHR